jgi:hypothetical protein
VLFVDGNFAGFQLVNTTFIHARAENLVTRGREACSGYQSYLATPDYRQSHIALPSVLSASCKSW